jgi:hypothetical protein
MQSQPGTAAGTGGPSTQAAAPASWALFFPDSAYSPQDRRAQLLHEALAGLGTGAGWELLRSGLRPHKQLGSCVVHLDYPALLGVCDSANLSAALEMQPAEGLCCLQAAVHEVRVKGWRRHAACVTHAVLQGHARALCTWQPNT